MNQQQHLAHLLQRQTEDQRWTARFPAWARDVLLAVGDWRGVLQTRMETQGR